MTASTTLPIPSIRPGHLGTVLPTPRSLAINDRYCENAKKLREARAASTPELAKAEKREVGGETRYYVTADKYAVVSQSGHRVLWFEVREDGDYAVRR